MDRTNFNSTKYWRDRYAAGGDSGAGSKNHLGSWKATVVETLVKEHKLKSVCDFGCGDGMQLARINFPLTIQYIGLDPSTDAIQRCEAAFKAFPNYCFAHKLREVARVDLCLSLDVIYHLVEDDVFHEYMTNLFNAASKWVMIYSTNDPEHENTAKHIKHRKFTDWIENERPEFALHDKLPGLYPYNGNTNVSSPCDFYFYKRKA